MNAIKIETYRPEWRLYFKAFNIAWIEKYFEVEEIDEYVLSNPEEAILQHGGEVLFAVYEGKVIGTVALKTIDADTMEMTKMAVDEDYRRLGAGKILCQAAIDKAREKGISKLVLYTQSSLKAALNIYRKLGFTSVPLEPGKYKRADTKMEINFREVQQQAESSPIKWFDRQFRFDFEMETFPGLLERLANNISKIREFITRMPELQLNVKPSGKWSVKEHVGHLLILETLWQKRFADISKGRELMSPADLNNEATDEAGFNQYAIEHLLSDLEQERTRTIDLLKQFSGTDFKKKSVHPRLQQPMRIIDLMYFVAEHDDHHLRSIITSSEY